MEREISNNQIAAILRAQAWERAKGELNSMLCTFYGSENFEPLDALIKRFTHNVEGDALHE